MKILLISGSFPPMKCGVGDYTKFLANALGERGGVSVAVLTDEKARLNPPSSYFQVFPVAKGWKFSDMAPILETIRHFRPDIVHIQFPTQGYGRKKLPWLLSIFLASMKIPTIQTWHEYYPLGGFMNIPNAIVGGGLIVVRPNYLEKMPSWFRWLNRKKHFRYIPNASPLPSVSVNEEERSAIRSHYAGQSKSLVAYFGFAYPEKNIEALFELCDPHRHQLVLVCDLNASDKYHSVILQKIRVEPWVKSVTVTGFLPADEVARILAVADVVVLPFRDGGGSWNTSLLGAISQGTFVLTTSTEERGYHPSQNIYFAQPGNIDEMKNAMEKYIGNRPIDNSQDYLKGWNFVSNEHVDFYKSIIAKSAQQ
jgi:glycosyltransferase involved in cell wall biosynthesis